MLIKNHYSFGGGGGSGAGFCSDACGTKVFVLVGIHCHFNIFHFTIFSMSTMRVFRLVTLYYYYYYYFLRVSAKKNIL